MTGIIGIARQLPSISFTQWVWLAGLAAVGWVLRDHIQEIARDAIDGNEDALAKYGILVVGGFIVGWYWAGQYPTTPGGLLTPLWDAIQSLSPL